MRVFKGLVRFIAVLGVLAGGFFVANGGVIAADVPDYRIQVSPTNLSIDLTPGKVSTTEFKVQNTGAKKFDYKLLTGPYSVVGDEYKQDLTTDTNYTYIKDWITFSVDGGTLEPGSEVKVKLTVNVPKDAPAGGQYATVFARMLEPEGEAGGLKAEQQIGMIVYSKNVEGDTRLEGGVIENKVPSFMFAPPISATSIVENKGNVHAEATYTLQVYPLFGNEEVYTNEENPEKRTILPETRRLNTMSWDGAPQLGIFRVKQTVKFLDDTKVTEKLVFICPLWFLFVVLAIIFLAIFWIVSRVRGRGKED